MTNTETPSPKCIICERAASPHRRGEAPLPFPTTLRFIGLDPTGFAHATCLVRLVNYRQRVPGATSIPITPTLEN